MKKFLKKVLILAFIAIVYTLINAVGIYTYGNQDEEEPSDVAIVLGASAYNNSPSPVYRERINHAIELYKDDIVSKLIMTGGVGIGNEEADSYYAKEYAVENGVAEEDIYIEETSSITEENLANAYGIMKEYGYKTAIIVSDPLHMKRAMLMANDLGMNVRSSPTETTKFESYETKVPFLARETALFIGYKVLRIYRSISNIF